MTDHETRRAADAVTWLIRSHDGDVDTLAAGIVALMRSRGWRHVPSLSTVPDDLRTPPRPPPDEWREARAALPRRPA